MKNRTFVEELEDELSRNLGEDFIFEISDQLLIREKVLLEKAVVTSIHLSPYEQRFKHGESMALLIKEIMEGYRRNCQLVENRKIDELYDFERVKDKILLKVIDSDRNHKLLEKLPHILMKNQNQAGVFFVVLENNVQGTAGCYITHPMLSLWRIDIKTLQVKAKQNMKRMHIETLPEMW